jgi:hypothetical protein
VTCEKKKEKEIMKKGATRFFGGAGLGMNSKGRHGYYSREVIHLSKHKPEGRREGLRAEEGSTRSGGDDDGRDGRVSNRQADAEQDKRWSHAPAPKPGCPGAAAPAGRQDRSTKLGALQ